MSSAALEEHKTASAKGVWIALFNIPASSNLDACQTTSQSTEV
jgi:hypothetical protein